MKKILVHGAFQNKNFGDILLLDTLIDKLRLNKKQIRVSNCCEYVSEELNLKRSSIYDTIFTRKIVFCGGGYFGERSKDKNSWYLQFMFRHMPIILISLITRKDIIVYGTGFGPINNVFAKFFLGKLFKNANFSALRDHESLKYIKDYYQFENVKFTYDLVLSQKADFFYQKYSINPISQKRRIAIHLPGTPNDLGLRLKIIDFIISNANEEYEIIFFSDNGLNKEADYFNTKYLNFKYSNINEVLGILSSSEIIITSKLHVGIVASIFSKKIISIYSHDKTARLYKQLGREDVCCKLSNNNLEHIKKIILNTINGLNQNLILNSNIYKLSSSHDEIIKNLILNDEQNI